MRLQNQVAIVTGAGRNIGEDISKLFVQEGAKVAVVDLDQGRANRVVNEINAAAPGQAIPIVATSLRLVPSRKWFKPSSKNSVV